MKLNSYKQATTLLSSLAFTWKHPFGSVYGGIPVVAILVLKGERSSVSGALIPHRSTEVRMLIGVERCQVLSMADLEVLTSVLRA